MDRQPGLQDRRESGTSEMKISVLDWTIALRVRPASFYALARRSRVGPFSKKRKDWSRQIRVVLHHVTYQDGRIETCLSRAFLSLISVCST